MILSVWVCFLMAAKPRLQPEGPLILPLACGPSIDATEHMLHLILHSTRPYAGIRRFIRLAASTLADTRSPLDLMLTVSSPGGSLLNNN